LKLVALEFGMGADIHGRDVNKAIVRAISDAIRHCSLTFFYEYSYPDLMIVELNVAVVDPTKVDLKKIIKSIPFGKVKVFVSEGGLNDDDINGNDDVTIANVGLKVFLNTDNHPFKTIN
tara:strand:- start:9 stop:365 length:357 start_codon:yes stop_codon:yes gene_type:complete